MALILDTSAVIGWVERRNRKVVDALAAADRLPMISVVTLGELHQGVESALHANNVAAHEVRLRTLHLAQRRLPRADIDENDAKLFGQLSAQLSRAVSHNDRWIAATALRLKRTLVTEDAALAAALAGCDMDIPVVLC